MKMSVYKNPVMVRRVTQLTDARYFAAMEVDWISMQLSSDDLSFKRWHAMKDWITGVPLAAELIDEDETLIAKAIIDGQPEGIITSNLDSIHLTGGLELFLITDFVASDQNELYSQIIPFDLYRSLDPVPKWSSSIFLTADWTVELISELCDRNFNGGICFNAVEETITGMKDYSDIEEMLGLLKK